MLTTSNRGVLIGLPSAILFFVLTLLPSAAFSQDCPEYFNDQWGVRLDMTDSAHGVLNDIPSLQTHNVSGLTYSNGTLSLTSTTSGPLVTLLQYTVDGSVPVGTRYGEKKPINSSFYRTLRVRMRASESTDASLIWYQDQSRVRIASFPVKRDWDEYIKDIPTELTFQAEQGSNTAWLDGNPEGLIFQPTNESGVQIEIDYIYLTTSSCGAGGTVSDLSLNIKRPDKKGGLDFAQSALGNSWNMNSSADIFSAGNVALAQIHPFNTLIDPVGTAHEGDFVYTENAQGNGDPGLVVVSRTAQIDSTRFVNFCFRGYNRDDTAYNSVARIFWADPRDGNSTDSYRIGDDIIMARGMTEYCVDMVNEALLEPALPTGSPNPWTSISDAGYFIQYLRLDMNEVIDGGATPYHSAVDYISLRADAEANTKYAVVVDADVTQQVDVYINTTASTSGGAHIGTLAAGRKTNVLMFDTTNIANGTYYIYATATKNNHTVARLADGRLRINHDLVQDTTAPILECERPGDGYTFDTQLEVAGYALDETRLATVEVLVDGNYFASIEPSNFHLTARDTYSSYAESNAPGFQKLYDATGLAIRAYTLQIVATDTAGNQTSCTKSVTRVAAGDTTPLTYPDPNGTVVNLSIGEPSFPIKQRPLLKIKVTKKKNVKLGFSRLKTCNTLTVFGSTSSNMSNPVTIFNGAVSSNISASFTKFPGVSSGDGKIFFQLQCSNGAFNPAVTFDVKKKIKSKQKMSESALISFIDSAL
ncbi:MAG: hypothetical protein J5J00_08880 [Deltaproteobacteria bacterium]|nr:hypothetical protein [Deltaproteobacteria bacterium]